MSHSNSQSSSPHPQSPATRLTRKSSPYESTDTELRTLLGNNTFSGKFSTNRFKVLPAGVSLPPRRRSYSPPTRSKRLACSVSPHIESSPAPSNAGSPIAVSLSPSLKEASSSPLWISAHMRHVGFLPSTHIHTLSSFPASSKISTSDFFIHSHTSTTTSSPSLCPNHSKSAVNASVSFNFSKRSLFDNDQVEKPFWKKPKSPPGKLLKNNYPGQLESLPIYPSESEKGALVSIVSFSHYNQFPQYLSQHQPLFSNPVHFLPQC